MFLLAYFVAVLGVYSYVTTKENEQMAFILRGQYANNMMDASEKLDELDLAVKKTLLFRGNEGANQSLEDIWRLSSDVKRNIDSLPIDQEFSSAWSNYLGRLGNFAREASRTGVSETEYHRTMAQASKNLRDLADEWEVTSASFLTGDRSIKSWLEALDNPQPNKDWSKLGQSAKQYTESDFPLTASESDHKKKRELQTLEDQAITRNQAVAKFKKLFPQYANASIQVDKSEPGSPYQFYHIRFAYDGTVGYADITEKGGHLLSFLGERPVGRNRLPFDQLQQMAGTFLKQSGYGDTVYEEARENNNAWHMSFVRVEPEHGAKVYSDIIHLKITKDDGSIVGLNAMEYIQKEKLKSQKITKINWNEFFNDGVTVVNDELAYVENDHLEQRLAHNLTVTRDEHGVMGTYRVVVDAETGDLIKTERLD